MYHPSTEEQRTREATARNVVRLAEWDKRWRQATGNTPAVRFCQRATLVAKARETAGTNATIIKFPRHRRSAPMAVSLIPEGAA